MKNTNYITGMGWMFNNLKLSGNDAWVFALIYGFSQDDVSRFNGSLKYICDTLNLSRNTVIKIIKKLEHQHLVIKHQKVVNNVTYNEYCVGSAVFALGSAETDKGVVQKLTKGSAETAPNNTIIYNNKESGARAFDFFKKESPIQFDNWLLQYKKTIKNFVKFIQDFNDKFDEEGKDYTTKIIKARLSRFARNWAEVERKNNTENNISQSSYQDNAI